MINNYCITQPSYTHATFTTGIPTQANQTWQNSDSSIPCYYSCESGWTGNDCSGELSCTTQPNYTHAIFTTGTPTQVNQTWQNSDSNAPCYYACSGGYTGSDCGTAPITDWRSIDPNCSIHDIEIKDASGNVIQIWAGCNSTIGDGIVYMYSNTCLNYNGYNIGGPSCYGYNTTEYSYNSTYGVDNIWGKLYKWSDSQSACINGYHVPSDAEWTLLENTLYGSICRTATGVQCDGVGWKYHTSKTSLNNFIEALKIPLAGFKINLGGTFYARGEESLLWSSTEIGNYSYGRSLHYYFTGINKKSYPQDYSLSVRCIKD